jgi:hypothetical protein
MASLFRHECYRAVAADGCPDCQGTGLCLVADRRASAARTLARFSLGFCPCIRIEPLRKPPAFSHAEMTEFALRRRPSRPALSIVEAHQARRDG